MRNLEKREALDDAAQAAGASLHVLALDVQKSETIEKAVASVVEASCRIDVLISNAGAGHVRSTEQATEGDVS